MQVVTSDHHLSRNRKKAIAQKLTWKKSGGCRHLGWTRGTSYLGKFWRAWTLSSWLSRKRLTEETGQKRRWLLATLESSLWSEYGHLKVAQHLLCFLIFCSLSFWATKFWEDCINDVPGPVPNNLRILGIDNPRHWDCIKWRDGWSHVLVGD